MLVDDPVKRVDNMTMAWGLEARVPFLDHELVELAAACPPELKLAHGGKGVLKEAARGVVPDAVIDRPKGYFPVPAIRHLEGPFLERVRDAVTDPVAKARGLVRRDWLDAMLADPNTAAYQPRLERVVAGGAAGDVAAGEGDLTWSMLSGACSADERVVTEADFVRRRTAAPSTTALFATAYSSPSPPPTGGLLAWISDRDGRPRAWLGRCPGRLRRARAGLAAAHRTVSRAPWDVQKLAWSPDGVWLACQVAPGGGERTRVRLVDPGRRRGPRPRARAPPRPRSAPGRPPGARSASRLRRGQRRRRRPASSTSATARPRCSPPGPAARGVRDQRRRAARRRPAGPPRRPAAWSWSTCAPGGAPS